ncbi:hypothetical protein BGX33_007415, partial [Mortierella sp. NVP41]
AAAFIATAHQNHFQFPHRVLHPQIQPLSTRLDLQNDGGDDDEQGDSFTSHELRALPSDMRANAMGSIDDGSQEFMTDEGGQLEDERGQGFESTTPHLDPGQVNGGEQFWSRPQHDPILFPSTTTDAAVDAIANQAPHDSRSEQDREVLEVCSRRLQRGYTPSQNIHKALVSSIRSSFLASLSGSHGTSHLSSDSVGEAQQPSQGEADLADFQQPWYRPQHPPYHASPNQEYASRSFEKDARNQEELLEVIARLEQDLQELHNSTIELQASLRESDERNERMLVEHDSDLRRVKGEYDIQIQDTKKRTKKFYNETMRKRQRDEDKRLEGLQEQLTQAQSANKELRTTIRGLQRERLDAERDQRDDLAVLCLFIENVLNPLVLGVTGTRGTVTPLQAVGLFKRRRPSITGTRSYDFTKTTSLKSRRRNDSSI